MTRILSICLAIAIVIMFAAPFARDAYNRHRVEARLNSVGDQSDLAAFRQWSGDPASFLKSLYERCVREQGQGAAACDRYRFQ